MRKIFYLIYYFILNYWKDIIAAISAIISIIAKFIWPQQNIVISISIIFASLIVIIYLRSKEREFYPISLTNRKDKDDWIGNGNFEYSIINKCFFITNADSGYIYSKCLTWSNYKYDFEFKILNKVIGVVVRAVNLSNYVMLQIGYNGIRPHIKVNGGWRVWEISEANLCFEKILVPDKWYKCIILVEKNSINIKLLDGKNIIFNREWEIPSKLIFSFRKDENDQNPIKILLPINLEYGSIGFRNCGDEKALIKNILIKKI